MTRLTRGTRAHGRVFAGQTANKGLTNIYPHAPQGGFEGGQTDRPDTGVVSTGELDNQVVRGLALSCHPFPAVAVAALTTVLAAAAGVRGAVLGLVATAVLAGQLCVGWVNDLVDRDRDRATGRRDKPLADDRVTVRAVRTAAVSAGLVCVPLSLALGLVPGAAHLTAVGGALAYDLGLKRTWWSWVPYVIGFGLLPVVVWLVSPHDDLPPAWMVMAGAALGLGAHGANVLPDYDRDRATGVHGLPQRLSLPMLRSATAAVLLIALALLTLGPAGSPEPWEWTAFGVGAALALLSASGPAAFPAAVAVGALAVGVLVARGALG
jgi:4-hydroxybenzoate polyprenyltransferase